jgi:hypothetical protein
VTVTRGRWIVVLVIATSLGALAACSSDDKKVPPAPTTTTLAGFCALAQRMSPPASTASPTEVRAAYDDIARAREALLAAAPSEIKADVIRTLDGYQNVANELATVGYDPKKLRASSTTDPTFQAAVVRLAAYTGRVCTAVNASSTAVSTTAVPTTAGPGGGTATATSR